MLLSSPFSSKFDAQLAGESGVRSVAGRARYVSEGRQPLVINEKFSQQLHLMRQVQRRRGWDLLKQRRFSEIDERVLKLSIAVFIVVGSASEQRWEQRKDVNVSTA